MSECQDLSEILSALKAIAFGVGVIAGILSIGAASWVIQNWDQP